MTAARSPAGVSARHHLTGRDRLVVLLAVNSGATDAIGFLGLGGAFTSVMTGNMVLAGVGLATGDSDLVLLTLSAIVGYIAGCAVGARVAGLPADGDPPWPRPVTWALLIQLTLTLAVFAGWWATDAASSEGVRLVLLGVNAIGLGIQSSAVNRFGEGGLSTTYLTGTLTTLVVRLVTGSPLRSLQRSGLLLVGLIGGAALGAFAVEQVLRYAPALQVVCLSAVLIASRWIRSD